MCRQTNKSDNSIKCHTSFFLNSDLVVLPEEQRARPLDVPLAVALDAGLEDERVGVEVVVRGDGAVLAAAAGVLHHHGHGQRDAAEIL